MRINSILGRRSRAAALVALAGLLLAPASLATQPEVQEREDPQGRQEPRQWEQVEAGGLWRKSDTSAAGQPQLMKADDLVELEVCGVGGDKIGKVGDAILGQDNVKITHIVLRRGGFLGFGQSQYAIPWQAIKVHKAGSASAGSARAGYSTQDQASHVELYIDRERLEQAPAFDGETRPDPADDRFWGAGSMSSPGGELCLLSDLDGVEVEHSSGEDLGSIEDIMIDLAQGRVAYATISTGDFLEEADRMVVVPWEVVRLDLEGDVAMIDVEKTTLQAQAFAKGQEPDLSDPTVARNLYEQYGQEPYWTVFGYATTTARLNFSDLQTVSGTIQRVESTHLDLKHMQQSQPGEDVLLEVKTDDGQQVSVFVGPRSYMSQNGMHLNANDRVTVTGVKTRTAAEGEVLVAKEIRNNEGQTLTLFDEQGNPQWQQQPRNDPQKHDPPDQQQQP